MATVLRARDWIPELKRRLSEMANAQFESEPFRRLLGLRFNKARAAQYMIQRTHWTLNRRECWAATQSNAPLGVKKLIWEHEREELDGDKARGLPDHYTLSVQEGVAIGLAPQDFERNGPTDGCLTCCYAWRHLADHSHWLKAVAASACLELSNSDEVVRGGGMSHRIAVKFRDEAGISFGEQPSNVEHMAADVRHANLLFEVIEGYVATEAERELILEGARESWAIDRIWKGQLADAAASVPL